MGAERRAAGLCDRQSEPPTAAHSWLSASACMRAGGEGRRGVVTPTPGCTAAAPSVVPPSG
eukprot:16428123-Heterocapsa_arctica.AAC.1